MQADSAAKTAAGEYPIGRLDDFEADKIICVTIAGRRIGVVRKGETVFAFADRCPHHGAPMCAGKLVGTMLPSNPDEYQFGLDGLVVRCPWHAYEFNLQTGESVGHTIAGRLFIYPTEVRDGEVFCRLKRSAST